MRLLRSSLLALTSLTAFTSCVVATNPEKWSKLAESSSDGIIKLDSNSYDELLAPPRNYSVSVLLTALPASFNCAPCQQFDPVFHAVAKSWKKLPASERKDHFFASLDFPDGQEVYQKLGLASAPTVQFHKASDGPHAGDTDYFIGYDLARNGFSIENFHAFINQLAPHQFKLTKPFNPWPFILIPGGTILVAVTLFLSWPILVPVLQSRAIWTAGSLLAILVFTSGHMWNRIRNPPYATPQGFVAPGFQAQYVLETQVVAMLYGTLAFSVIALAQFVPAVKGQSKQRIAAYLWLMVLLILFSILIKLFKMKNGGYPFGLLFG